MEREPAINREMTVEMREPGALAANPQNYRAHSPEQIAEICKSLRKLGQYRNVVVNTQGVILAGHGVVQAACEIGMPTLAVHVFDGTPEEERFLMVADNELSRMADDDDRALSELLKQINKDFGDLRGTGWDEAKLANFIVVTRTEEEVPDFDAAAEWAGMPELANDERETGVKLIVWFDNETDRDQFMANNELKNRATHAKHRGAWSTLWPPRDEERGVYRFEGGGDDE